MVVTFIIIAYNASDFLQDTLNCLLKQTFDHSKIQIILVNSASTDNTKKIMESFSADFNEILVLENPKKILPCGWNVALKKAKGDLIIRVDAHVLFESNFVEENVKIFEQGEKICGGKVESISKKNNKWIEMLNDAENSIFGGSFAKFRRNEQDGYVDTLGFAAYSREVFEAVGGYDERLARTEDNEIHYRMKKAGYKFFFSTKIHTKRITRNTLKKLVKQKYMNGYWIGKTLHVSPKCFSLYHYIPAFFVVGCLVAIALFSFLPILTFLYFGTYFSCLLLIMLSIFIRNINNLYEILLPFILFSLHISYGVGIIWGYIKGFFSKDLKYENGEIENVKKILRGLENE